MNVWIAPMLASIVLLGATAGMLVARHWPRKSDLSPEEHADLANAPTTALERRAWIGLGIGLVSLGTIAAILMTQGAAASWESDALRLAVLGIFTAGLAGSALSTSLLALPGRSSRGLDERDRAVLARASMAQSILMILGLAAWTIALSERFRDEGAVPVVYLNLIFGSIVLLMMIGQAAGILLGYRLRTYDAQG
jgi:MFS family permease